VTTLSRDRVLLTAPLRSARVLDSGPGESSLDTVLRAERERAFAAGIAEGRDLERVDATERLDVAVESVNASRQSAGDELARTAIELATSIARTLLRTEISAGRYDLEAMVREALAESASGRRPCVVHLNPADCARLADVKFRSGTVLQADEGIAPGDVQVETSLGLLVREAVGAVDSIEERLREELL
jgi:flagellar biosynthesis/type III secretory pathway protein FliH